MLFRCSKAFAAANVRVGPQLVADIAADMAAGGGKPIQFAVVVHNKHWSVPKYIIHRPLATTTAWHTGSAQPGLLGPFDATMKKRVSRKRELYDLTGV